MKTDTITEKVGEWNFTVRWSAPNMAFMGWCAKVDDLSDSPLKLPSAEDVRIQFGKNAHEVLEKLKKEVLG